MGSLIVSLTPKQVWAAVGATQKYPVATMHMSHVSTIFVRCANKISVFVMAWCVAPGKSSFFFKWIQRKSKWCPVSSSFCSGQLDQLSRSKINWKICNKRKDDAIKGQLLASMWITNVFVRDFWYQQDVMPRVRGNKWHVYTLQALQRNFSYDRPAIGNLFTRRPIWTSLNKSAAGE